jgi:DNA-binding NarL/FixJ family response regulator
MKKTKNIILIGNKTALWVIEKILKDIPDVKVLAETEMNLGMTGIETLIELQPDVIILLLDIPELRAITVIRKLHKKTTAKIILISVIDDKDLQTLAEEAGAHIFLLARDVHKQLAGIINSNNTQE